MKKLLTFALVLALALCCVACGENFTEVTKENYATTLSQFAPEGDAPVTVGESYRLYFKMTFGDNITESEQIATKDGAKSVIKINDGEKTTELKVFVKADGAAFFDLGEKKYFMKATFSGNDMLKELISELVTNSESIIDSVSSAIPTEFFDVDDPDFAEIVANITKLEVSGKKGDKNHALRISSNEDEGTSSFTIRFNEKNQINGFQQNVSFTQDEEEFTSVAEFGAYDKSISFPSENGYTEITLTNVLTALSDIGKALPER